MKYFQKIIIFSALILLLTSCAQIDEPSFFYNEITEQEIATVDYEAVATKESIEQPKSLPATFDIDILFASQAPFADWGLPYQEACEEASLIMAYKYFANQPLDKKIMDEEINKVVKWENDTFGYYTDTNLDEVAFMAKEYFKLNVEISAQVTAENIKRQLVAGNLVIIPASGRDLDNPNFTQPGPLYHMLVIRGYDRNEFITNDPGTRKGLKFKYKYDNLLNAVHDLYKENGEVFRPYEEKSLEDSIKLNKMRLGEKKMLIIKGFY